MNECRTYINLFYFPGTPAGTANSKDYNLNICQATVRWAMLDQILNPCPCFKDVIHAHFYMKKHEVLAQVETWIQELEIETKKEKKSTRTTKKNRSSSLESFKKVYTSSGTVNYIQGVY